MSCLFNSLSHFIKEDSNTVRQKICDYLQAGKPIIDGISTNEILQFEGTTPEMYVSRMRNTSTWGGAIEIQAACNIWEASVNVDNRRDVGGKTINFAPVSGISNKTFNIYWIGGHYEPIRA